MENGGRDECGRQKQVSAGGWFLGREEYLVAEGSADFSKTAIELMKEIEIFET